MIKNAYEHFFHIALHFFELGESFVAFIASLAISMVALRIIIPSINRSVAKGFNGEINGLVSFVILLLKSVAACAIEMDGGDGCHG